MDTPRVFISYAREDHERVRAQHKRLLNAAFLPWLDKEQLVGGEDWDRAIRVALEEADFIVLCLSETSTSKRGYLQRELRIALDLGQQMLGDDIYLLPVRLESCQMPRELAGFERIDLFEWRSARAARATVR